jgi:Fumarylacetoacetate (FAA) hydrolase family
MSGRATPGAWPTASPWAVCIEFVLDLENAPTPFASPLAPRGFFPAASCSARRARHARVREAIPACSSTVSASSSPTGLPSPTGSIVTTTTACSASTSPAPASRSRSARASGSTSTTRTTTAATAASAWGHQPLRDYLVIGCAVDGEKVPDVWTGNLIFSVPRVAAELCAVLPLGPGDVIFTAPRWRRRHSPATPLPPARRSPRIPDRRNRHGQQAPPLSAVRVGDSAAPQHAIAIIGNGPDPCRRGPCVSQPAHAPEVPAE